LPSLSTTRLGDLQAGQQALVEQIPDSDSDLLRYLDSVGLVPEARLVVLERLPFDDNLRLQVEGQTEAIVLGPRILGQILVKVL
jgi:DtxR family Mn-dependent transcriptional regulator